MKTLSLPQTAYARFQEKGVAVEPLQNRPTLLIAEDEASVSDFLAAYLSSQGYRVLLASNGDEALNLWQMEKEKVSLLITDIKMPGRLSGRDLAEQIKQEEPMFPVIFISGWPAEALDPSYFVEQVNFLQKPFSLSELFRLVQEQLKQRH